MSVPRSPSTTSLEGNTPASKICVWRPAGLETDVELRQGQVVGDSYPRHWHDEYQFCLTAEGENFLAQGGTSRSIPARTLYVVAPREAHANWCGEAGCHFRSLYVHPRLFLDLDQTAGKTLATSPPPPRMPLITSPCLIERFEVVFRCLESSTSQLARQAALLSLLAQWYQDFTHSPRQLETPKPCVRGVREAAAYLEAYFADGISLADLARIAHLSPYHLNRSFAERYGMPPHAFQTQVRVCRAKHLLRSGLPIAAVAAAVGFNDQSHLTRHFTRLVLQTPGQYQRQVRKNVQDGPAFDCHNDAR